MHSSKRRFYSAIPAIAVSSMLLGLCAARADSPPHSNVLLIFDSSGSMKKVIEGRSRMDSAKAAVASAMPQVPAGTRVGLMVFGHRRSKDCSDIQLVSPIGAESAQAVATQVASLEPKGETPIAAAIEAGTKDFAALKGQNNAILLVTDGIEECGGDPCAAARQVKASGFDLKVNVVGLNLDRKQRASIECLAKETGGKFFSADKAADFSSTLKKAVKVAQAPAPKPITEGPIVNLVSKEAGGQIVAAPGAAWGKIISGNDKDRISADPGEAIFAFKDDKPATITSFSVLVPSTSKYNLKDFELATANDLSGPFKSIGKFTTKNIRLFRTPYQEFKFQPVAAKYLRFKTLTRHDGAAANMYLYQVRIMGRQ